MDRLCFRELLANQFHHDLHVESLALLMDAHLAVNVPKTSVLDALALVFCVLGHPDRALEVLNYYQPDGSMNDFVISLRRLEALLLTVGLVKAMESLDDLTSYAHDGLARVLTPSEVDLYLHFALVLERLGISAEAVTVCSYCFEHYSRLEDEPGSWRAANLLARCTVTSKTRQHWAHLTHELALKSSYRHIRATLPAANSREPSPVSLHRLNVNLLKGTAQSLSHAR